jgi:glutaredoxin
MAQIEIYTTPAELCQRITRVFDARGFDYSLIKLETQDALDELTERSGRKTCPVVYVGDELIGGLRETLEAVNSGRIAELIGA